MAEYIKLEDAIEVFEWADADVCEDFGDGCNFGFSRGTIRDELKRVPAADVAPVIRGTWQLLRHDKYSDVYQCSQCGRKVSLTHGRDVVEHYPYCHCGARMSEGPAL